jgi:hypothetical protein
MPTDSPHASRRARALAKVRRRIRWLEIETHRTKAELARLEAEFEDGVADRLSGIGRLDSPAEDRLAEQRQCDWPLTEASAPRGVPLLTSDLGDRPPFELPPSAAAGSPVVETNIGQDSSWSLFGRQRNRRSPLAPARSIMASLGFHICLLLVCLPLTVATLVQQKEPELTTSTIVPVEPLPELSEIEMDGGNIDGLDEQQAVFAESQIDLAADMLSGFLPVEPATVLPSLASPTVGSPGVPSAEPGTVGAATMPGDGGGGGATDGVDMGAGSRGGRGGVRGSSTFFGAKSLGDRFVFVIDDSSSMKDGRLEAAVAELVRSVDAMSRRQSFYVIFVSDQTYPMFYPDRAADLLPATPENKKRLGEWLPKVRLASGKNRELIKALDMAASLRPHAVFLLWDGDLRYSEAVRTDVMTHLTRPRQWDFVVHTLGMGTLSADSESNLAAIAQAHGGMYRRIDVPKPGRR